MKHWTPDMSAVVPLDAYPQRRRKRDWTSLESYAPPRARPRHRGEARLGGWIGLAIVALLCAVVVIAAANVLSPPHPVDKVVAVRR